MDEIVKRKQALTGEVEDAPFKGLREFLFKSGIAQSIEASIIDGIARGIDTRKPLFYVGKGNSRTIDSTARLIDEQGES